MINFVAKSLTRRVLSEIEMSSTSRDVAAISNALDVDVNNVKDVKKAFSQGYGYDVIDALFNKYATFQERHNEPVEIAEFLNMFSELLSRTQMEVPINESGNQNSEFCYKNSLKRIYKSIIASINYSSVSRLDLLSAANCLNVQFEYVEQVAELLDTETSTLANLIIDKWFSAKFSSKKIPTIRQFLSDLSVEFNKYQDAINLTKIGANKEQLLVFTGMSAKDATPVRKSVGITSAVYDQISQGEDVALFDFIEEYYEGQEKRIENIDLIKLLIELSTHLDEGLRLDCGLTQLVRGGYNATFAHLIKLLEYNATYGAQYDTSGKRFITAIICERIAKQYESKGKSFATEGIEFGEELTQVAKNGKHF